MQYSLDIPLYANDPALNNLGTKSGCREVFRDAGILFPDGFENLQDEEEMAQALNDLKTRNPEMRRAVVKLNDGFSGEGNALFYFDKIDATDSAERLKQIRAELPNLRFEAPMEHWDSA